MPLKNPYLPKPQTTYYCSCGDRLSVVPSAPYALTCGCWRSCKYGPHLIGWRKGVGHVCVECRRPAQHMPKVKEVIE